MVHHTDTCPHLWTFQISQLTQQQGFRRKEYTRESTGNPCGHGKCMHVSQAITEALMHHCVTMCETKQGQMGIDLAYNFLGRQEGVQLSNWALFNSLPVIIHIAHLYLYHSPAQNVIQVTFSMYSVLLNLPQAPFSVHCKGLE